MENLNEKNSTKQNFLLSNMKDFFLGIYDSLEIFNIFGIIYKSDKVLNYLKNCLLFNAVVFILPLTFFDTIFGSASDYLIQQFNYFSIIVSLSKYFYYIFWLIPLYLLCSIITSFWIDEIYYTSLETIEQNKTIDVEGKDIITAISNQLERLLIIVCFILTINIANFVASYYSYFIIIKYALVSILNSLYVFEYILMQKYILNYKSILFFIENRIFYFLGFGLLLTIMVNYVNSFSANSSIFLLAFPLFLITSIKVNKRFDNKELHIKRLIYLLPISWFYDLGMASMIILFKFMKKQKRRE